MIPDPTELYRLRDGVYAPDLLIVAVAELDLFSWLYRHGPVTIDEMAAEFELAARPADVMVTYLVARGVLDRDGPQLRATELAREHLTAGSPYDLRAYYASLKERPGCAELMQVLRTGEPASWSSATDGDDWSSRLSDPAFAERITAAMDARGRYLGPAMAGELADLPMRRILDVGGSSGIYASAVVDRFPNVGAAVFERPPVDVAARTLLTSRGYGERVDVLAGDMFAGDTVSGDGFSGDGAGGSLPSGFDVHLYSHVLHDWDEPRVRQLFAASFNALPPGGYVLDHDVHVDADKTGPLAAAEYSVFLMHATPGKCWSIAELGDMLRECGFTGVEQRPTVGDRSLVLARKPA